MNTATLLSVVVLQALVIAGLLVARVRARRAEAERRRQLATMAHLDQQVAIEGLISSLAHELNQPLGAILRNAEAATLLLASGAPIVQELREIVDDIRDDDRRASDIIRNMRASLREHDVEAVPVDLTELARETLRFVEQDAASRKVRVIFDTPPTPTMVTGDRVRLRQVVRLLLANGVEASASAPDMRREVVVKTACSNGAVELSVTHCGAGFSADALPRLFDPSFGPGARPLPIGLSVSRSIVEAHQGRIAAVNNAEGGATVRVTLPIRNAEAVKPA
jgi:signal transduction histidine kinase